MSGVLRLSSLSTEYVPVEVTPTGTNDQDPSSGTVALAVVAEGTVPADGDWVAGEWDRSRWPPVARVLAGPAGDLPLEPGSYEVWVRFGAGLESPVLPCGSLEVF